MDGKGPLFIWLQVIFLKIFPTNMYVFSGRLVSVIAGLFALIGIYKLSLILFSEKRIAFLAVFLYIICPFALLYDRIALFDSTLSSLLVWVVYFSLKTAKSLKFKDVVFWGVFLFLAIINKFSAVVVGFLSIFIFATYTNSINFRRHWKKMFFLAILAIIPAIFSQFLFSFSSGFPSYVHKFVLYTSQTGQRIPIYKTSRFLINISLLLYWIYSYFTPIFFAVSIISILAVFLKERRIGLIFIQLAILPIFITGIIAQEIAARYALYTVPYFIIPSAYFFYLLHDKRKILTYFLFLITIFPIFLFDISLLSNPVKSPFPRYEKAQFITGDSAGYGLGKVFSFINNESKKNKITVITLGTVGLFPYAFNLEFWENPRVNIIAIWPIDKYTKKYIQERLKNGKVFVAIKKEGKYPPQFVKDLGLKVIFTANRPENLSSTILAKPGGLFTF